jgi:hypothetical protein
MIYIGQFFQSDEVTPEVVVSKEDVVSARQKKRAPKGPLLFFYWDCDFSMSTVLEKQAHEKHCHHTC